MYCEKCYSTWAKDGSEDFTLEKLKENCTCIHAPSDQAVRTERQRLMLGDGPAPPPPPTHAPGGASVPRWVSIADSIAAPCASAESGAAAAAAANAVISSQTTNRLDARVCELAARVCRVESAVATASVAATVSSQTTNRLDAKVCELAARLSRVETMMQNVAEKVDKLVVKVDTIVK